MADNFNNSCLYLANNPEDYHPVATNHYTLTLYLPQTLINYADPQKRPFTELLGTDTLTLALKIANQSIAEPSYTQQPLQYKKGNLTIEFPGTIDAFTSQATFHVFVTKSAFDILYSWKLAAGNPETGEVGDPRDYWADASIDITTGNKGTLVGTWNLYNVWCQQLQGAQLDLGQNTPKMVTITLKYFRPTYTSGVEYSQQ